MLIAATSRALEPSGEGSVKTCPFRLRDACVGDLTGHGVFDRVLALARDRGAVAPLDKPAFLEHAQVRLDALEQLVDGAAPERPADHGTRLERGFLLRGQEIDTGGDDSLDRVRNREAVR